MAFRNINFPVRRYLLSAKWRRGDHSHNTNRVLLVLNFSLSFSFASRFHPRTVQFHYPSLALSCSFLFQFTLADWLFATAVFFLLLERALAKEFQSLGF